MTEESIVMLPVVLPADFSLYDHLFCTQPFGLESDYFGQKYKKCMNGGKVGGKLMSGAG